MFDENKMFPFTNDHFPERIFTNKQQTENRLHEERKTTGHRHGLTGNSQLKKGKTQSSLSAP